MVASQLLKNKPMLENNNSVDARQKQSDISVLVHTGKINICLYEPGNPDTDLRFSRFFVARASEYMLDITTARYARDILSLFSSSDENFNPDVVIVDMSCCDINAEFRTLSTLLTYKQYSDFLLVVVVDYKDRKMKGDLLDKGIDDVVIKPLHLENVLERIMYLVRHKKATANALSAVSNLNNDMELMQIEAVASICKIVQSSDHSMGNHIYRVGEYASMIADTMGFPHEFCGVLRYAAKIHDLGKLFVPIGILEKPSSLTAEEMALVKQHPENGYNIIKDCKYNPVLAMASELVLTHHEDYNGRGYPYGIGGNEIPVTGRIVAVADVFDALTHTRPYKAAWSIDEALDLLQNERGKKFDPDVVDAFLSSFRKEIAIYQDEVKG